MAGNEPAFAQRMTKRGAGTWRHQRHVSAMPPGLPDPEHRMSVRDLAVLARYIISNFPEYYNYYAMPEFTWNNITQKNRNPLLQGLSGRRWHEDRLHQGGGLWPRRLGDSVTAGA